MSRLVARAETWERVYDAFQSINFAAFDYTTVKQSILDYIKLYFPETFNDFIESSEFIAIVEVFAYIAELMAYRLDINAHENFISTAQRKDSILRLAKLVSYTASRPLPARGLVKITSVNTTESLTDSNGNDLANRTIRWNDPSNAAWKDQFILIMNRVMDQEFGSVGPTDRFQIQDVLFELYSWNLIPLQTGVFSYAANVNGQSVPMELVPVTYDSTSGIVERRPKNGANFTMLYGQDGLGDASDTTGFFLYTKQGRLQRVRTVFDGITPNQMFEVNAINVNDTDVWVNNVDPSTGELINKQSTLPYRSATVSGISGEWVPVDLAHAQNVIYNTNPKRNKYEVETRDGNRVRLVFGDGEFADIPSGTFDIWTRSSLDEDISIPQAAVVNASSAFTYIDAFGKTQTFTFTYSLINSLQNASAAESIEHVRSTAPAVYYSQDRMVNGQDYNVFMLQDPSILKLRAINRTFAGDSKYIKWHDASGTYENVKIFGNDGILYFESRDDHVDTPVVDVNTLIQTYIEPLLSSTDIYMQVASVGVAAGSYRRRFNTEEKLRITAAVTPPPTPAIVYMFYKLDNDGGEWFAINCDNDANLAAYAQDALAQYGWPSQFITTPLIKIVQQSIFETRYTVARKARRLIFHSPTTAFWNTNDASRIVEYDTLRSSADNLVILQANVNYNRTGILQSDVVLDVLGTETITTGAELGLPDVNRISVLPADVNQDGIPDDISVDDVAAHKGVADIIKPKLIVTLPTADISPAGFTVTLPIHYAVGANDISVIKVNGSDMVIGNHWLEDTTSMVSNKIIIKAKGTVPNSTVVVTVRDYVYFTRATAAEPWSPAPTTPESIHSYIEDQLAGTFLWKREEGRSNLNFAWMHYSPRYHLIDPAPSNIIDSFVVTKGYYLALKRWLEDPLSTKPALPTPLDLRTSYAYLIENKMISDTIVLHPGRFKLLFGARAEPAVRASFKVIRSNDRTLTDNQIKTQIVTAIRNFFEITNWEFGETFYFTELATAIHNAVPTAISSIVLVPSATADVFGDLFQVIAREDELFYPDIDVDDIEIVTAYTADNLRKQSPVVRGTVFNVIGGAVGDIGDINILDPDEDPTNPTDNPQRYCDRTYCDNQYIQTLL